MMVPAVVTASKAGATVVACIGLAVNTSSAGGDRLWGFEGAPSPWHGPTIIRGRGSILVGGLPARSSINSLFAIKKKNEWLGPLIIVGAGEKNGWEQQMAPIYIIVPCPVVHFTFCQIDI